MINNKEKKMIQRYCIYPKIAVVALIFSFVQCALIVPLEMIDDLVFQNKGFQPTGMFTALGFVIIYVIIFCFCALAPKFGMNGKKWKSLIGRLNVKQSETDYSKEVSAALASQAVGRFLKESNQMRGRAIRVMKEHPEKTSNIWHLVCLRPWNEVLKADDNQISEDYSMLERRMEHFLGLHYTENTIENGMKRLSVIKTPFNKTNIDRINRQMLKMSGQRDTLKERWNSALAVYDKMDIVDETEVKDKFVTSVVFWDAILTMILSGILCLIGAIGAGIVAAASQNGILAGTCYFFIAAGLAGIMIRFPKIFMLGSPLKRLKAFGNGIRKALEEQQLLEETHCKVETESNGPDNHIIYLSGGSGRDKALFAQCVNEFFDVIDNQRYILVKKKGHKGLNGFYAIPNCFSKKKEDAERFAKCMHPYIGNYDCVYTRNEKGRELLLEGRVKALANREERCISHKKVKGALE